MCVSVCARVRAHTCMCVHIFSHVFMHKTDLSTIAHSPVEKSRNFVIGDTIRKVMVLHKRKSRKYTIIKLFIPDFIFEKNRS